jgi:cystathionine beta-lyase
MPFDFDRVIDRRNTHSAKWDRMNLACGLDAPDAIAMWVADMDFAAPPAVTAALRAEVERGTHGYYASNAGWRAAQCDWLHRRHGWRPDPEWLSTTPGIVSALGLILQAFSEPGDDIVVFSPAYHAFRIIIEANGRRIHNVPMIVEQGRQRMDVGRLRRDFPQRGRIVFLCSPHNPGGRVWAADEIREVADLCRERDLLLVSDEIHCDLVYPGAKHLPTATVAPDIMDRLITCVAATKTFNLAGGHVGATICSNPELRKKLDARINAAGLASYNLFGMIATEAALRHGGEWLDALLPYLAANRDHFAAGIARAIPGARAMPLEATYLAWVDFSGAGLPREETMRRIRDVARIGVSPGPQFGPGGENYVRFNFATPRYWIDRALERLADAFAK